MFLMSFMEAMSPKERKNERIASGRLSDFSRSGQGYAGPGWTIVCDLFGNPADSGRKQIEQKVLAGFHLVILAELVTFNQIFKYSRYAHIDQRVSDLSALGDLLPVLVCL